MEQENQAIDVIQSKDAEISALIRKIAEKDRAALATLFDETSRLLFGLVLRILRDRISAEEALVDVYTYIWKQAASYEPRKLASFTWLIAAARNQAIARLRWNKQEWHKYNLDAKSQSETTVSPELQRFAHASLKSLAPTQQEALEWAYFSGLSCSEIAAHLGRPLGAVKTHARIGLMKLGEIYRPLLRKKDPGSHEEQIP